MKTTNKLNVLMIAVIAILLFACSLFATLFFLTAQQLEMLTPPDGYSLCVVKTPSDSEAIAPVVAKTGEISDETLPAEIPTLAPVGALGIVGVPEDIITKETVSEFEEVIAETVVEETVIEETVPEETVPEETETADFSVPQVDNAHCNNVELILQEDYAGVPFGKFGTVGTNGSAITAVSMVANYLGDTSAYTPVALAEMFGSYATYDEASDDLFPAVSEVLGIDMPYQTNSWKEAQASLMDGSVVIAKYNNANPFTNDKHYIVIKGADYVEEELKYFVNDTTLNSYFKEGVFEGFINGFDASTFANCNSFWIYNWDEAYGLVNMAFLDSYNAAWAYEDAQIAVEDIVMAIEEINHALAEAYTAVHYAESAVETIAERTAPYAIERHQALETAKASVAELQTELEYAEKQLAVAEKDAETLRVAYENAAAYAEEMRVRYEGE